jgi:uncharacterized membrane protein
VAFFLAIIFSTIELKITAMSQSKNTRSSDKWLDGNWIKLFLLIYGIWVILPLFAPFFMQLGWTGPAKGLYKLYSLFCHQLPQRSLFLFGQKSMYSLVEVQTAWQNTYDPLILRNYIGNPEFGWKIAWSDRMISFYGGVWLFGLLWWPLRKRIKQIPWWAFFLLLAPMFVDGTTHLLSDLAGISQGFRDANIWLVRLTDNALPALFYAGDALGSFNSWMRWITGLLSGLGIVWFTFPTIDATFKAVRLARKL